MLQRPASRWLAGFAVLCGAMTVVLLSSAPRGALRALTPAEEHEVQARKAERRERFKRRRTGEEEEILILHPAPKIDPAELAASPVRAWAGSAAGGPDGGAERDVAVPAPLPEGAALPPLLVEAGPGESHGRSSEPEGTYLEGRVLQVGGRPVEGLALRLRSLRDGQIAAQGRSGLDGRFQLLGLVRGTYRVEIGPEDHPLRPPGGAPAELALGIGRNQIELQAPRLGSLEATVRAPDGRPLAGAELRIRERFGGARRGRTDSEGRLRFDRLPVGSWRVLLFQGGIRTAEAQAAVVAGGVGRVELSPPAAIEG